MGDELYLQEEAVRLAFARSASVRLTPGSLGRFAVLLGRRAETDQDRQIADALNAMPMEQVPAFLTETTPDGKRLREIAPFEVLLTPDEMDMIASGIEDPIIEVAATYKRRQIDDLVTGTVNASTTTPVTGEQIAAWIRDENTADKLARNTLATFFLEVPLGTQVAFLAQHGLEEERALRLATDIEVLGRTIPLQQRSRW
jgi:hypothetical protein